MLSVNFCSTVPHKYFLQENYLKNFVLRESGDMKKSHKEINEEWKCLPSAPALTCRSSSKTKCYKTALGNGHLNRYQDVLPFENTRVKLGGCGYINASYIEICTGKRYISSQAPLPQSFDDFWQMVWESHIGVIVMLARFIEKRRVKAHCYWPAIVNSPEQFRDITVTLTKVRQPRDGITIQHFTISKNSEIRKLVHLHYTDWPDFGVPDKTDGIREMKRLTELYVQKLHIPNETEYGLTYPVLVHCSAGIGRAGTFLAFLNYCNLIKQGSSHSSVSVANIVSLLRKQRMCMVQTKDQYLFIYHLIQDEFDDVDCKFFDTPKQTKGSHAAWRNPRSYCSPTRNFLRTTQKGINTLAISSSCTITL